MEKLNTLSIELLKSAGVDPRNMYCASTGMIIGRLTDDAQAALFASCTPGDDESMGDELLIRTLASARPSPAWNMFERDTLERIRHSNPKLLLTYLLNRLYTPLEPKGDRSIPFERRMEMVHTKIKTHNWIQSLDIGPVQLNKLLLVLLELDARWSLLTLGMPKNIPQIWASQSFESIQNVISSLNDWLTKLITKEIENNRRLEESDRSFIRGNKLVKSAYMQEFARQTPRTPERVKTIQREARKQDGLNFLDKLENELTHIPANGKPLAAMTQAREPIAPYTPRQLFKGKVVTPTKAITRFGGLK